jgi:hypothetical protein
MFQRVARFLLAVSFLATGLSTVGAEEKATPVSPETQIYNAVLALMKFPKQDAHILIANTTLNAGCGENSGNPVLMNGCGIFGPPTTAAELEPLLKNSMPQLAQATWQNLVEQSASSVKLEDHLQSPWPHAVVEVSMAGVSPWKSPDGMVFFSRVGVNKEGNQALVYVLFFSYMTGLPTSANFFLFQLNSPGEWDPIGRVTSMETQ